MNIGQATAPGRCPLCLRTKAEALADHVRLGEACDCPDCPFREEILAAIQEEKQKPKFTFSPVRKPLIVFSEHKEKTINNIFDKIHRTLEKYT